MESFDQPLSLTDSQLASLRASAALLDVAQRDAFLRRVVKRIAAVTPLQPSDRIVRSAIQLVLSNQYGISAGRELLNTGDDPHDPLH